MLQNAKYTLPHVLVHVKAIIFSVVVRFCQKNMLSIYYEKVLQNPSRKFKTASVYAYHIEFYRWHILHFNFFIYLATNIFSSKDLPV